MPYLFSQEPFPVSKLCIFRSCFTLSFQSMCFWGDKGLLTVTSRLANCCSLKNSQSRNFPPVRAFQYAEDRVPRDQLLLLSSSLSCSLFTPVFLDPIYPSVSFFPSLCCFLQYFFLCFFFYPWFISNWSLPLHSVSNSTVIFFCCHCTFLSIPCSLAFEIISSLGQRLSAILYLYNTCYSGTCFYFNAASTNKWFIGTQVPKSGWNTLYFSCNHSLLPKEINKCNKYAMNA